MTNEELIQKIRTKIEELYSKPVSLERWDMGYDRACEDMMEYLSTLEESETTYDTQQYTPRPSVGIEDVARVQFASHAKVFDKKRKAVFDWSQFKEVAGIFYGFGKKDRSDTLESEKPMNQDDAMKELDEKIALVKQRGTWDGVDVDKYMDEVRGREPGKPITPNDLKKAADKYIYKAADTPGDDWTTDDIRNAYIAGYKLHEANTPLPEDTVLFNKGVEEGKRLMMEEAVEAKIYGYDDGSFELIASWLDMPNNSIYKDGDKVRIIILKED